MALKKNKDSILAAISAAVENPESKPKATERAQRSLPRGTIGSVRAGLGGIQEIDTKLILSWGPPDRLETELTAVNSEEVPESVLELATSIAGAGQQIPVLLRPAKDHDGHFEVVYGRRRILACKKLGITVKALIRTLDDTEALMAKGLENSSRTDLSFYERARFATAILDQGYDRATACQALSVSKNTLSQLERITRLVPSSVGDAIGAAPDTGRPKWMTFATLFEGGSIDEAWCLRALKDCSEDFMSDDRLSYLIKMAAHSRSEKTSAKPNLALGDVGTMTMSNNAIKISLSKEHRDGFKEFLEGEIQSLLQRYKDNL